MTYINNLKSLLDGSLGVEGETGINLGGDLAGNNVKDLLAELHEKVVEGVVDLVVDGTASGLAELDGSVNELGVIGLLGSGEDQRGVGGSILRLVLVNGSEVTRVANNDLMDVSGVLGYSSQRRGMA